ncbi:unnamed protein product [Coffea canephora]|uniref:RING-type E3 ubiquitin transferase n=1 Tax=Coffea canephora TaxID=49390 RepID=A0A068U4R0_COFCA|nr:unnamed protein product [Coffea canephora]
MNREAEERGGGGGGGAETSTVAVAVAVAVKSSRGKGSRRAVRWAVEKMIWKAEPIVLVHVIPPVTSIPTPSGQRIPIEEVDAKILRLYVDDMKERSKQMLIPFKKLCKRRRVEIVVLEGDSPASALVRYVADVGISALVVGSCSPKYGCFRRKPKSSVVPSVLVRNAPESCDVFVVSRRGVIKNKPKTLLATEDSAKEFLVSKSEHHSLTVSKQLPWNSSSSTDSRTNKNSQLSSTSGFGGPDSHIQAYPVYSTTFLQQIHLADKTLDFETVQSRSSRPSTSSEQSNVDAEVERLRQELYSTLSMYNQACEDLVYVQKKVNLLSAECLEEERRVDAARQREEILRKVAAREREKHLEAMKEIEMAKDQCVKEANERQVAETNALNEFSQKQKIVEALFSEDKRYRRYTRDEIEEATGFFCEAKVIGSGAYGKVYKCSIDHTPVAIKVLQSDASDKKEEFLREVEVLSLLRHPHIVLLLGACPEIGCLVYEYMENGSLEDYILPGSGRGPLPWFIRFRIVYEVACGLAFLHNSGPEPIVHRDLKPGNILLDRNYVSKIGDVGLAKIISEVVPDNVTEYQNSILAGTICYMDPEYQRTGTVRPKSDLYALGIIALQLLTACRPNRAILKVENAIKTRSLSAALDKSISDWPLAEVKELAQMALKCCKLRCRDRPDLETELLPVLERLARFADVARKAGSGNFPAPSQYYCPILQEIMDDPHIAADGFTYEHIAIKTWLDRHDVSPVTKVRLQTKMLTPNHILRSAIQEWRSSVSF